MSYYEAVNELKRLSDIRLRNYDRRSRAIKAKIAEAEKGAPAEEPSDMPPPSDTEHMTHYRQYIV